jgi:glycosyltransferase involved in cell wall biosynthesis
VVPVPADRPLKVLIKSPFSDYSGYGRDGFGLARALARWGCDVYLQPTWLDVPVPRDLLPLFAKELRAPFDLLINHWDPGNLFITPEARQCARVAVAWTMWEFAGGPGKDGKGSSGLVPHCERRSSLRRRLRWYDLVLGYDPVSLDALEPYIPARVERGVLQGGFDAAEWKKADRDWFGDRFGFIMHGALNDRKQPWVAIQAFNELKFEKGEEFEGATFALHTNAPGKLFPELNEPFKNQKIRIFVDAFDRPTLDDFYASAHCLLAPSRGEGKNLPALEFQATGGVVAGTNFGGHTMWMNADYAYPLDYKLAPTFPDKPWAAHDARVSIEHLKEVIWHIYTHRGEARQKGELASRVIPQMCDWSVVAESLFRRIGDQVSGPGPEVAALALACRREAEPDPAAMMPAGWRPPR